MELTITVVAALVSGTVAALLTHRLRAVYEDRRRWHAERRLLYGQLIEAAREVEAMVSDFLAEDYPDDEPAVGSIRLLAERQSVRKDDALTRCGEVRAQIGLISTAELRTAAEALHDATRQLSTVIEGFLREPALDLLSAWRGAYETFESAARQDLDVGTEDRAPLLSVDGIANLVGWRR